MLVPNQKSLKWLETTGGPPLLLDRALLPYWHGYAEPKGDVSDYERACQIGDYLGTIAVGTGNGVVLGEEPFLTTWWQSDDSEEGFLVRWVYAENEAEILDALPSVSTNNWVTTDVQLVVSDRELVLFDSACPGTEIDSCITIPMSAGSYAAQTLHYEPNERTSLILHRFVLKDLR